MAPGPRPLAAKALREAHMDKVKFEASGGAEAPAPPEASNKVRFEKPTWTQSHKWVPKLQAISSEQELEQPAPPPAQLEQPASSGSKDKANKLWKQFEQAVEMPVSKAGCLYVRLGLGMLGDMAIIELAKFLDASLSALDAKIKVGLSCDLNLARNAMGDSGLIAMINMFKRHAISIRVARLYGNDITDIGAARLADAIANQDIAMEELHMSHNYLTASSLVAICLACASHRPGVSPCWLRLEHNCIAQPLKVLQLLHNYAWVTTCTAENRKACAPKHCVHCAGRSGAPQVHLFMVHTQRTEDAVHIPSADLREQIDVWWNSSAAWAHKAAKVAAKQADVESPSAEAECIVVESSSDSGEDSEARFSLHSHQSSISTSPESEVPGKAAAVQDMALKNTPEITPENTPEIQQTSGVERSDQSLKKRGKNKINADQAHGIKAPPGLEKESIDESDVLKDGQLAGRMLLSALQSLDASCAPSRPEPQPLSTDEYCLWAMQAREDKEMGADELNEDTFGANAGGGWSFEENLAANQVLANQGLCAQQRIGMLKNTLKEIANFISIEPWCLRESVRYVLIDGWKHITWRNDYTGLHLAAEFGAVRVLPLLISLGADPTARDGKGRTPSDIAAAMQQWSCVSMLETVQKVHEYERNAAATLTQAPWEIEEQRLCRAICQAGYFLEIQPPALREAVKHTIAIRYSPAISNPRQFSPALHIAAQLGRSDVIPMLLALRIDPKEVDASGRTAIDVACDNGHWDCFCAMAYGPSKKGEAAGRDAAAKHELLRSQAHEPLRLRALPGPR